MTSELKVNAQVALSGTLNQTGPGEIQQITASYALSATTASFLLGSISSASYAQTASLAVTASFALTNAGTVTSAATASLALAGSGSFNGIFTGSYTGTFIGDGSHILNVQTSSFTLTSSLANSASYAATSTLAPNYLPLAGGTITGNVGINQNLEVDGLLKVINLQGLNQKNVTTTVNTEQSVSFTDASGSFFVNFNSSYVASSPELQFILSGSTGSFVFTNGNMYLRSGSLFATASLTGSAVLTGTFSGQGSGILGIVTASYANTTSNLNGVVTYSSRNIGTLEIGPLNQIPSTGSTFNANVVKLFVNPGTGSDAIIILPTGSLGMAFWIQNVGTGSYRVLINSGNIVGSNTNLQTIYPGYYGEATWTSAGVWRTTNSGYTATASLANTASLAITASAATSITFVPPTASFALTASVALNTAYTSSYALNAGNATLATTASYGSGTFFAQSALSSSYALTSSYAITASYGSGTFFAQQALSSSYAVTASNATNAINATTAQSASYGSGTFFAQSALSSSYALTSSFAVSSSFAAGMITTNTIQVGALANVPSAEQLVIVAQITSGTQTGANTGNGSISIEAVSGSLVEIVRPLYTSDGLQPDRILISDFYQSIEDQVIFVASGSSTGSVLILPPIDSFPQWLFIVDASGSASPTSPIRILPSGTDVLLNFPTNTASIITPYGAAFVTPAPDEFVSGTWVVHTISNIPVSASYAVTASNATNAINATTAQSASYGSGTFFAQATLSSSYAVTASNATNAINATIAQSASYGSGTFFAQAALSSSYALTSSYASVAQSLLGSITSASYALTASYALNGGSGGGGGTPSGSATAQPIFTQYPFTAEYGFTTLINPVPATVTELDPSLRIKIDLTDAVSASTYAHITTSGPSGSWLTMQYSTDEVNWTSFTSLSLMNTGTSMSIYSPVPVTASTQVIIRAVTTNGDGATTVELGSFGLGIVQSTLILTTAQSASFATTASFAVTASYAMNGGGGGGPATSASYATTASVAQYSTVISGSGGTPSPQLTSSIIINPGFVGAYVLLDPNTSSLSVNLPTHSLGQTFNIRHAGISGSLTIANTSNVTQSVILPGFYYTFVDDGNQWWVY